MTMVCPQSFSTDFRDPLVALLGLGIPSLGTIKPCEIVESNSYVWMILSQRAFAYLQRALKECFGLNIVAQGTFEHRLAIKRFSHIRVFFTQGLLADCQGALVE